MRVGMWVIVAVLTLTACATPDTAGPMGTDAEIRQELTTQKALVVKQANAEQARLHRLAYPILKAGVPFCANTTHAAGVVFWSIYDFPYTEQAFARNHLGLDEAIRVNFTVPNGPGAKAGLRAGDIITHINGKEIGVGRGARKKLITAIRADKDATLALTYTRAGKARTATIKREIACDVGLIYQSQDGEINAFADQDDNLTFTRGILRFVQDDTELATIIAHELAHVVMQHIDKKITNAGIGTLAGLAADLIIGNTGGDFTQLGQNMGGGAHSVAFEQEADYVGLYIMARAGYDTSRAANVWRRMSAEDDISSLYDGESHPSNPERFIALTKTHAEIMQKRAKGQPLLPNKTAN